MDKSVSKFFDLVLKNGLVVLPNNKVEKTDIAINNCKEFITSGSKLLLVIKSRSIDTTQEPESIYEQEMDKLESNGFEINQMVNLHPFDKDHALVMATLK